ncbi:MAG: hypothetical protein CL521_04530 [Actinobacteria bacterium]|nr:hypothetical protein [Actinomycetota bacterium]
MEIQYTKTKMIKLICTGQELLDGRVLNHNQVTIAQHLNAAGYDLGYAVSLPDDTAMIVNEIRRGLNEGAVMIITGGLGPTHDDVTRSAIAEATGRPLYLDEGLLAGLKAYYKRKNKPYPEANIQQAMLPEGSVIWPNLKGTAAGFYISHQNGHLMVMPGVPSEMEAMLTQDLIPKLRDIQPQTNIKEAQCYVFGIGESQIMQQVQSMSQASKIRYEATPWGVKLSYRDPDASIVHQWYQGILAQFKGQLVTEDPDFLTAIMMRLQRQGLTVAIAESCTGGQISQAMTGVPGASAVFNVGLVTYSNTAKHQFLGIDPTLIEHDGAVSETVAKNMAQQAREKSQSDIAMSVTGIAGPGGGSREKPVGTVYMGMATKTEVVVRRYLFQGDRAHIQHQATRQCLLDLYQEIGNE